MDNKHIEVSNSSVGRKEYSSIFSADVIVPVKYKSAATYIIPHKFLQSVTTGSWVEVDFGGKSVNGVIADIKPYSQLQLLSKPGCKPNDRSEYAEGPSKADDSAEPLPEIDYKEIKELLPYQPAGKNEISFCFYLLLLEIAVWISRF